MIDTTTKSESASPRRTRRVAKPIETGADLLRGPARLSDEDARILEQARAILNAQAARTSRLKAAHDVIKNEGDMSAVRDQVEQLHVRYLELAQQA